MCLVIFREKAAESATAALSSPASHPQLHACFTWSNFKIPRKLRNPRELSLSLPTEPGQSERAERRKPSTHPRITPAPARPVWLAPRQEATPGPGRPFRRWKNTSVFVSRLFLRLFSLSRPLLKSQKSKLGQTVRACRAVCGSSAVKPPQNNHQVSANMADPLPAIHAQKIRARTFFS